MTVRWLVLGDWLAHPLEEIRALDFFGGDFLRDLGKWHRPVPERVFPGEQGPFLLALDFFGGDFLRDLDFFGVDFLRDFFGVDFLRDFFGGDFLRDLDFFGGKWHRPVPARVFPGEQGDFLLALDFFGGDFILALDFLHIDLVIPLHFWGIRHLVPGQPHLVVLLQAIYLI